MKNKKEELRMIPKKNYAKISTIFVVTILIVVVAFVFYRSHMNYVNTIPVIRGAISEIEEQDFNNYVTEHDDFLVYVGVANDSNCHNLEEDLKEFLKSRIISDIIYLNITSVSDKEKFYNEFNSNYSSNVKLNSYPAFIIFSDKKVVDLVQRKESKLHIGDIEKLLDEYGIHGGVK